jgi:hypothetical protein
MFRLVTWRALADPQSEGHLAKSSGDADFGCHFRSTLTTLSQLDQFKSITPLSRKDLPCARMRLESTLGQVSVFRLDGGWPDSSHHSFLLVLKAYKNQ